jgi:hypothetical protein
VIALGAHALHAVTWVALRVTTPLRAERLARALGSRLPPLDEDRARSLLETLSPWGSCLSQSLTVAARLPGAQVAIGVDPQGPALGHAWVEWNGAPLRPTDPRGAVIAHMGKTRATGPRMC